MCWKKTRVSGGGSERVREKERVCVCLHMCVQDGNTEIEEGQEGEVDG